MRPRALAVPPASWDDEELIARLLSRQAAAWSEFVRRYRKLILECIERVTRRFQGVLTSADREDIFSTMMCNLQGRDMHQLRMFQAHRGARLGTWVGLLARHAAYDFLRTVSRRGNAVRELGFEGGDSPFASPASSLETKESFRTMLLELEQLTPRDRALVQLLYIDDLEPAEVAREMSISIKTVYSKKHKLRVRLQLAVTRRTRKPSIARRAREQPEVASR